MKNHKLLIFAIIVISIMIISLISLFLILSSKVSNSKYGNRLDKIGEHEISDKQVKELKENIKELEGVENVAYELEGKLVDIIITVDDAVEVDTAKSYANKTIEYLDDDQKTYYDVQVFIVSNNKESEKYPIVLYKNKTSDSLK